MATSLKGTMTKDPMINPATGQPYNAEQQARIKFQQDQLSGKISSAEAQKQADASVGASLKKSTTINNYTSQNPVDVKAQQEMNTKYGLDPMAGFKGQAINMQQNQTMPRDFAREQAMAKKLGITNPTPEQEKKLYQATYSPDELQKMGLSSVVAPPSTSTPTTMLPAGVPGTTGNTAASGGYASAQQLKDMGLTNEVLKGLVSKGAITQEQMDKALQTGMEMDAAQALLSGTPKPTNATLGVLEAALKAKSGVGNQALGESDLFKQAGLNGYAVLAQNLSQRSNEMNQNYNSYANIVSNTASSMADVWGKALEGYKAAQDSWNKQSENLSRVHEKVTDWENTLSQMKMQYDLDIKRQDEYAKIQQKYEDENLSSMQLANGNTIFVDKKGNIVKQYDEDGNLVGGDGYEGDQSSYEAPGGKILLGDKYMDQGAYDDLFGVGEWGGQCGTWASTVSTASKVGNTWKEKRNHIELNGSKVISGEELPKAGYKLLVPLAVKSDVGWGHVALVTSFDPATGDIQVVESNKGLDEVVRRGKYNINTLKKQYGNDWGFVKGEFKSKYSQIISKQQQAMAKTYNQKSMAIGTAMNKAILEQAKLKAQGKQGPIDMSEIAQLQKEMAGLNTVIKGMDKSSGYTQAQKESWDQTMNPLEETPQSQGQNISGMSNSQILKAYEDAGMVFNTSAEQSKAIKAAKKNNFLPTSAGLKTKAATENDIRQIRKEAYALPSTKTIADLTQRNGEMQNAFDAYQEGKIGANVLDQSLTIMFNKMLDPGSVVKEGEYARTANGQDTLSTATAYLDKLTKGGGGITDDTRQDMIDMASEFMKASQDRFNREASFYVDEAGRLGIEPDRLLGSYAKYYKGNDGSQMPDEEIYNNMGGADLNAWVDVYNGL